MPCSMASRTEAKHSMVELVHPLPPLLTLFLAYFWGQVVYFTPDNYPHSAAMVMCSDDNDLSARLEPINEQFEEYALLIDVLKAICQALDIGAHQLQSVPPARPHRACVLPFASHHAPHAGQERWHAAPAFHADLCHGCRAFSKQEQTGLACGDVSPVSD